MKSLWKKEVSNNHFRVAVFGSARITKGDPHYKLVKELARRIAHEGLDIVTGGGPGLMEAANEGHHLGRGKNHSHSIGLRIKLPFEEKAANHLDIKREFPKFSSRLDEFMHLSHVVVIAPGGVGTLLEFLYTWQLVQVSHICPVPIILLGDMWTDFVRWIKAKPVKRGLIGKQDLDYIFQVKTAREAMEIIKEASVAFAATKGKCAIPGSRS